MQEVDINMLVDELHHILSENIPNNIIIIGKINELNIEYKYHQLDLSNIICNKITYYNQEGEDIKNHILPKNLKILMCPNNELTLLPDLPNSLKKLECENNQLISLPNLPNSLKGLYCYNNQIAIIHKLPDSLLKLNCCCNPLKSLPILPTSLNYLILGYLILEKIEYNPDYKNIKYEMIDSEITIGDYIIKSKEDYISYMEDYEKYLFSKIKSARK